MMTFAERPKEDQYVRIGRDKLRSMADVFFKERVLPVLEKKYEVEFHEKTNHYSIKSESGHIRYFPRSKRVNNVLTKEWIRCKAINPQKFLEGMLK